ncbi:outer membrane protein [Bartonella bacilliformis]|uniref:outer membrane protein n=1 Tax=Bartonella bacilliformis TaxID=774 RepID=UPI000450D1DC|nr:outer membrane protein [Bartonella bacilliformis]EYS95719.1 hypothetical protein X470_00309 [Bartonella bacilliformis Peru-18]KEG15954.1 hypothetical protein H709_01071 [Bartonella bacilliformis CUSCO5]
MKMRYLSVLFGITLGSSSVVNAADVVVINKTEEEAPASSSVFTPADLSWTGVYLGGQISGFSSKVDIDRYDNSKWSSVEKSLLPEISGFSGGLYVGSNIDLGEGFILGVETDALWSNTGDKKTLPIKKVGAAAPNAEALEDEEKETAQERRVATANNSAKAPEANVRLTGEYALRQQWIGATRARVGFAIERFMPYVTGGLAYGQLRGANLLALATNDLANGEKEEKLMVGYAVGAGLDFAVSSDIFLRTEYRFSDLGKKKFANEKIEVNYKINDFRVGVAYKF